MTSQEARDLIASIQISPVKAILSGKLLREGMTPTHSISVRMKFECNGKSFVVRIPYEPIQRTAIIQKAVLKSAGIHPLRVKSLKCSHSLQQKCDEALSTMGRKVSQAKNSPKMKERISSAETTKLRNSAKAELKVVVRKWCDSLRTSDFRSILREVLTERATKEVLET